MDLARAISLIFVGLVNVALALAVYLRNRRNPANRSFAVTVVASVAWLSLAFLSDQPQLSPLALPLNRLTLATGVVMGGTLLYFVVVFPSPKKRLAWGWAAFLVLGAILAAATALTPLVVTSVRSFSWGTSITPGMGMIAFSAWLLAGIGLLVIVLWRKFNAARGLEKAQLRYMLLGIVLFTSTSIVFGLILPALGGSWQWASLNTFTPLFLFGFTAYAMIRHRLMDMRLVIMRGVLYALLVAVLASALLAVAELARAGVATSLGMSPNVAFVAVGLIVMFAFQPTRLALEDLTDHFFYRKRYDQQALLASLSSELAVTVDPAAVSSAVGQTLSDRLKVDRSSLVHKEPTGLTAYGSLLSPDDPCLADVLAISTGGSPVLTDEVDESLEIGPALRAREIYAVVPLATDAGIDGALVVGAKRSGEAFSSEDMHFLELIAPEVSIALRTTQLFEQRNQRVRELTALNQLASVLGQDIQLDALLRRALGQVIRVVGAEGGSIMLYDPSSGVLRIGAAQGLSEDVVRSTQVHLGEGIAGWVAEHRKSLLLLDDAGSTFRDELQQQGVKSALSVPLIVKNRMIGVLNLDRATTSVEFSRPNLSVVTSFAGQLAVAIENAKLYGDLEAHFLGTITALAAAVDAKDPYTFGHSSAVTEYALAIADELGLSAAEKETLRKASILHDIGKIGIEGSILNKPGPLSPEERELMQRHPIIGANILGSLDFLVEVVPLVLCHHERPDGLGYPARLSGADIPLGARIIAIADSYNAMTSDRPYRAALSPAKASEELRANAGTQFDAQLVDVFLGTLAREEDKSRREFKPRRVGKGAVA